VSRPLVQAMAPPRARNTRPTEMIPMTT
jgi:hypothetical protein